MFLQVQTLDTDGEEDSINDPQIFNIEGDIYLIYYLAQGVFGNDGFRTGTLVFEYEAIDKNNDAMIEIDADVDDPLN